jgi:5-methylcytosine-specific restriction endonuclease McrA
VRRRRRVGEAARERRAAGGKRAIGRPSVSVAEWGETRRRLFERAQGRCECCGAVTGIFDPEHALDAGDGGSDDLANLWYSCRSCHEMKTAAYARGRLRVIILGGGRFRWEFWRGRDKQTAMLVRVLRESP